MDRECNPNEQQPTALPLTIFRFFEKVSNVDTREVKRVFTLQS